MKRVIVIPGLGDHETLYKLCAPFWWLRGYKVAIYGFNWNGTGDNFASRFKRLLTYIEGQLEPVYVVGVSAGGVPALLSLVQQPQKVIAAAAIASPLYKTHVTKSRILNKGLETLVATPLPKERLAHFLSVFGSVDHIVDPKHSKLPGATLHQTDNRGHVKIIAANLTIGCGKIAQFFNRIAGKS